MSVSVKEVKLNSQNETTAQVNANAQNQQSVQNLSEETFEQKLANKKQRTALNLSVIGLILSVFFGIGIFFSIAGMVSGACNRKENALSAKYAVGLGVCGIICSAVFATLLVVAIVISVF